jgi:hypothetical protein
VVDTPILLLYVRMAMLGLKKFLSKLSQALDMSELVLIERQRALLRAGLLDSVAGRGPGSGVRLNAETMATLLTAILATPNLLETIPATRSLLSAKRDRREIKDYAKVKDTLGGAETFKAALSHVLTSDEKITVVRVYRRQGFAVFYLEDGRPHFISKKKPNASAFDDIAQIHIDPIRALLRDALKAAEPLKRKHPSKTTKEKA